VIRKKKDVAVNSYVVLYNTMKRRSAAHGSQDEKWRLRRIKTDTSVQNKVLIQDFCYSV
jgi:hypothetical protein